MKDYAAWSGPTRLERRMAFQLQRRLAEELDAEARATIQAVLHVGSATTAMATPSDGDEGIQHDAEA